MQRYIVMVMPPAQDIVRYWAAQPGPYYLTGNPGSSLSLDVEKAKLFTKETIDDIIIREYDFVGGSIYKVPINLSLDKPTLVMD